MITDKEYFKLTNSTPDFYLPKLTFEEIQRFLVNSGYQVIINHAEAKTGHWTYNMGGEAENFVGYEAMTDRIVAIKDDQYPPKRNDSQEAMDMDFIAVFHKEIKKKLLGL